MKYAQHPGQNENFTDDEVLGAAEALTWESIGSFERLRYLGRLLVHGP